MPKLIPTTPADGAGSSSLTHYHPPPTHHLPHHTTPPRRSRSPPPSSFSRASPSSALLSLLATITLSSHPVDASPTPPQFLCPSLSQTIQHRSLPPSSPTSSRPKTRRTLKSPRAGRTLPYKYDLGEDGFWRRVESYTLYGSTVCSNSCREPTNAVSSGDNSAVTGSNTSVSTAGSIDLQDTLPAGWVSNHASSESRTTLILALSLVLAFFICFFIIGCLFWRKTLRRKHKESDVETRARRRDSAIQLSTEPVLSAEKEAKVKQKIWVRATARWKANARYTARHRKGKRPTSIRSQPLESTTTLNPLVVVNSFDDAELTSAPENVSRNISRQSSCICLREGSPTVPDNQDQERHISDHQLTPASIPHSSSETPTSPPAYRQRTLLTSDTALPGGVSVPDHDSTGSATPISTHHSHSSLAVSSIQTKHSQPQEVATSTVVHAAHVATDDKALLARLADLAERPPGDVLSYAESSHQLSAPVWEDEQVEHLALGASDADTSSCTSQSLFPPPPSKGKMADPLFYDYPFTFEQFSESIEPELEPSAPPFEAHGTSVTSSVVLLPSAPPLLEGYPEGPHRDVVRDPSTIEAHFRGDCNGRMAEHSTAPSRRPLSEGTLPDYQP